MFYGETCLSKPTKFWDKYLVHFKTNIFISIFFAAACHYLFTCSGHGLCSNIGTCQCDDGFYGDDCSSKLDNMLMASSCNSLNFVDQNMFELQLKNKYCNKILS